MRLNAFQKLMCNVNYVLTGYFFAKYPASLDDSSLIAALKAAIRRTRAKQPFLNVALSEDGEEWISSPLAEIPLNVEMSTSECEYKLNPCSGDVKTRIKEIGTEISFNWNSTDHNAMMKTSPIAISVHVGTDDHMVMFISCHHAIADATSVFIVASEIIKELNSFDADATNENRETEIGLVDWMERLGESDPSRILIKTVNYDCDDETTPKRMRTDREIGIIDDVRNGDECTPFFRVNRVLSKENTMKLRRMAKENGCSVWSVLQAATSIVESEIIRCQFSSTADEISTQVGCIVETRSMLNPPLPSNYVSTPGSAVLTSPITFKNECDADPDHELCELWRVAQILNTEVRDGIAAGEPLERLISMEINLGASTGCNNYGNMDGLLSSLPDDLFRIVDGDVIVETRILPDKVKVSTQLIWYTINQELHIVVPYSKYHFCEETVVQFLDRILALLEL